MTKIDTTTIAGWNVASKTRPIKAKPLINLLVDRTVTSKFLVDTLEGREPLGDGVNYDVFRSDKEEGGFRYSFGIGITF